MLTFLNVFHSIYNSFPMSCKSILWSKIINPAMLTLWSQRVNAFVYRLYRSKAISGWVDGWMDWISPCGDRYSFIEWKKNLFSYLPIYRVSILMHIQSNNYERKHSEDRGSLMPSLAAGVVPIYVRTSFPIYGQWQWDISYI